MNNLKKTIGNTLINNLEALYDDGIELKSIERCSDLIEKMIKDIGEAYTYWLRRDLEANGILNYKIIKESGELVTEKELFGRFIESMSKEEDK